MADWGLLVCQKTDHRWSRYLPWTAHTTPAWDDETSAKGQQTGMGKPTSADRCRAPPILKKIINSNEPGECVCECVWRGIFSYSLQVQNNNTAKVFSRALKYPARHAYHQFDFLFIRFDTVTGYTAHTKTVTRQEQNKNLFFLKGGGGTPRRQNQ